jgi:hypothetical protein
VNETVFIAANGAEFNNDRTDTVIRDCQETMNKFSPEPLLFLFAAGRSSKIIIADLVVGMADTDNIHTFVDVGASLDGFAGKHSRDYNDPKKFCQLVRKNDPNNEQYWMKRGVCGLIPVNQSHSA